MVASGTRVRVHYIGTFDDGTQFDNSYEYGEALEFTVGGGHMIIGFDAAVAEMEVGEKRTVRIEPHEGYGEWREDFVEKVPCDLMPGWELLPIGQPVELMPHLMAKITQNSQSVFALALMKSFVI